VRIVAELQVGQPATTLPSAAKKLYHDDVAGNNLHRYAVS
jgi:hypothetical protein